MSVDPLLVETAERLLADASRFEVVEAAEATGWSAEVWDALAGAGFCWVGVPETAGGSGGSLEDACALLRAAGAAAAPVPLGETAVLAGWMLSSSGGAVPEGAPLSVGTGELVVDGATVSGRLVGVPWGRSVAQVVALATADPEGSYVVAVDPAADGVRVEPSTNLAGEPRDTLLLDGVHPVVALPAVPEVSAEALRLRGALVSAQLMAGALGAMSRLTVAYTNERRQFGQPVARFQAVQAHLVHGAQDAALALMAAEVAARQASRADEAADLSGAWVEIAAARVVAGEAAVSATRAAHQAHGAMGLTREYPLHHLSRRLWAWSRQWGSTASWRSALGTGAAAAGADRLYPTIAAGTAGLG
jgi:acyl-CoA dehydrogenase